MKILVISQYYHPEQFRITDICETLVSRGHHVTVLTGIPNYPEGRIYRGYSWFKKKRETISGVEVIRVPIISRGKSFIRLALNYVSFALTAMINVLFLKKDFDVVYVYQLSPVTIALPGLLYKKLTGKKVFLYCLDIWPESIAAARLEHSSIIYKVMLTLSRFIYLNVDSVAVTSRMFVEYLHRVIGLKKEKINYLPQYAEEVFLIDSAQDHMETSGKVNLLFTGNVGEMQSVESIIRAAAELKELKDIKWHIVGDGSAKLRCEKLAVDLGVQDKVIFYGQRPLSDIPHFYASATALLVTLKNNKFLSYTLPAKIQSYMASGKPIIGSVNGEARIVIEDSNCGLCCEAEDYHSLANLVKRFISEPEKYSLYGSNSRKFYESHFSKNKIIDSIIDALTDLAKG